MDDHSSLEPIEFEDHVFLNDLLQSEEQKIEDQFPNHTVLANRACKIYPKSSSYSVIRFGDNYRDIALAATDVIHYNGIQVEGTSFLSKVPWAAEGYFNARRIESTFNGVKWLATLVWTGLMKPSGSSHLIDAEWAELLNKYNELGYVLDITLRKPAQLTIRSIACDLTSSVKDSSGNTERKMEQDRKEASSLERITF